MPVLVVEGSSVTRIYKNVTGDILRVDTMFMESTTDPISSGVDPKTFRRTLTTQRHHGPASRVVTEIEIYTDADTIETASGNYTFVAWTGGNAGTDYRCNMSDLPAVGDTV